MKEKSERSIANKKGWAYLTSQNKNGFYSCYIGESRDLKTPALAPPETSFMLITEALLKFHPRNSLTKDSIHHLKELSEKELITYFEKLDTYPPDSDVNALGYSILLESGAIKKKVANNILSILLANVDGKGVVQVWITEDERPKQIDHVVATNILYLACLLNRQDEMKKSIDYISETLNTNEYLKGSRYYNSSDSFLFALARIFDTFPTTGARFYKGLHSAALKRINEVEYPLDIAMIIIVSKKLGIDVRKLEDKLLNIQNSDGSWPADALFRFGSKEKFFGSKALTTAYAIRALEL